MKIAMIGQKQIPSRAGGIEVAVEELCVRMVREGHQVTLYNQRRCRKERKLNKLNKKQNNYQGVRICEVPVIDIKGISAVMRSVLATACAVFGKYDCIHFHAEGPAVMTFLPHRLGIRTVVTIHGLDWQRSKWGNFASWYLKLGEKTAVACADEIIVLSQAMKQYFWETYHRETVLIPNGIEKPEKKEAKVISRRWGLQKDSYILYLGRIVPEKGLENLIQAFLHVKTEKKLVIAGAPSDTDAFYKKLQKLAETDDRILFTGFVKGTALEELYSNSYFYCLPSELEGMPISLLEAMSYGNCCVCSDIAECVEVMGEYGYIFEKGNVRSLRNVLQKLCNNSKLIEECRKQVSDYVCQRYNWDEITEKTLALYKE